MSSSPQLKVAGFADAEHHSHCLAYRGLSSSQDYGIVEERM